MAPISLRQTPTYLFSMLRTHVLNILPLSLNILLSRLLGQYYCPQQRTNQFPQTGNVSAKPQGKWVQPFFCTVKVSSLSSKGAIQSYPG